MPKNKTPSKNEPSLNRYAGAYKPVTPTDYQHATREIVQEIALLGLWRGGFFQHASFYGGTALRIFHGLRRFSEDLDFTRLSSESTTHIDPYLAGIATELDAWGFSFEAESRSEGERIGIESAFLKGNTQLNLLHIGAPNDLAQHLPSGQKLKIKLKMDLNPPIHATTEVKTQLLPTPYQVTIYDRPSLFAGKLHAVFCRGWKSRVKGRDFYDFVWYVGRNIRPNLRNRYVPQRLRYPYHPRLGSR